jgi:hypothetical protein
LPFDGANVINFRPTISEGSVEIEAFGSRNLRIPYAAVMALYETPHSVTMVHAYARNHGISEIEDETAVLDAREGCIGLRANDDIETIAFFHNGHLPVPAQTGTLIVTNVRGEEMICRFAMKEMRPFETMRFAFDRLAPDFRRHLDGSDGWGALHFANHSGFPRMLVRWRHIPTGEVQVTHSNFDYQEFETDLLEQGSAGHLEIPEFNGQLHEAQLVLYPRCTPGTYQIELGDLSLNTEGGVQIVLEERLASGVDVKRLDGPLPSRLVTAISGRANTDSLAFECSFGVFHSERPPKRFHWGVVSPRFNTALYLTEYSRLYDPPDRLELTITLYASGAATATKFFHFEKLEDMPRHIALKDLFENADEVLGDQPGYITVFCNWGGLLAFTSMQKENSFTIEHSF